MTTSNNRTPQEILELMWENDKFSQWLGLENIEVAAGFCKFQYTITAVMMNGFGTVHGGVLFAAADSALAFASNSHDNLSVALEVSISYTKAAKIDDRLTVIAKEIYQGNRTAVYDIKTYNQHGELLCVFKGTVYRTKKQL